MARIESAVAWLNAPRQLEFRGESVDSGNVTAGQVLCETLVTAISPGTELAAYVGLPALRAGSGYPRLQGYCNVARVLAVGAGVSHLTPGQRVLSFASHRTHFSIPAGEVLQVLAAEDRSEDMACAYLFHLGYNAVLTSGVRPGSRVLVIGLGVLGLTSVAMAALAGASVVGVSEHRLPQRLGLEFGARAVLSRSNDGAMRSALTADLADVVITTSMDWSDWQLALQLAGHRATIACLGFPGRNRPPGDFNPLDSRYFYAKQLRIEAVGMSPERPEPRGFLRFNERDNLEYVTALTRAGRLKPAALVCGTYAGSDLALAYEALLAHERPGVTYLLRWAPG